ncbi:DUF262 domain-containing protein [Methylomicrobium sp. RS1]|jgi:hypothetical protein|uniref:DUF262 domain-containing protein n=1 Tax=Candidatus Methylomicrobium oryzae TaxID=2802053 RepID=UPI0019207C6C|nr:DUF262 domain-containing protein [Methylomicrobium sp. RS1]MBL1263544.1 DUF262 domain-containing protein [Methylomicrobium sp. RS1]
MTISRGDVSAVTVGNLLAENLRIPHYQRPYSWEPETALQLLDDIQEADRERRDVPYVLGAVILHNTGPSLEVVDGQQRLLTLRMILLLTGTAGCPKHSDQADNPINRVWNALRRHEALRKENCEGLAEFIRNQCQLVRVVTDDVDEAFRVFDSQNYRGKPLAPHDLLKAYHLREMRDETVSMKAAVVETWESVTDAELNRLFSTYLYRIARWARGESAPRFTVHDIGMFKGISPKSSRSPCARYHMAAQVAIPVLDVWRGSPSGLADREAGRIRFHLDAPLLAGKTFFEMAAFMLKELRLLAREAFDGERAEFALYNVGAEEGSNVLHERPSRSRYRFVSELYLAALLYYTNKFGDEDLPAARDRLFAWAYSARVELLRVQFRSIDNRARGDQSNASAFALMRTAESGRVIRQLSTASGTYNSDHEKQLVALLKKLEA